MRELPTEPILITATAGVLIGTPQQPQKGFVCSIETTHDKDRPLLTTDGIRFTHTGLDLYIKCLAAGFAGAVAQAIERGLMPPAELLPLLLKHIDLFTLQAEGGIGKALIIATPGPKPSTN